MMCLNNGNQLTEPDKTHTSRRWVHWTGCKIDHLTAPYIFKNQAQYIKFTKNNLPSNTTIVLVGYAEKYTFVIQDVVQGYH